MCTDTKRLLYMLYEMSELIIYLLLTAYDIDIPLTVLMVIIPLYRAKKAY